MQRPGCRTRRSPRPSARSRSAARPQQRVRAARRGWRGPRCSCLRRLGRRGSSGGTRRHQRQQADDSERNRQQPHERVGACGEQSEEACLRRVRDRRHHVGREHGQRLPLREALGDLGLGRKRTAEECLTKSGSRAPQRGRRFLGSEFGAQNARGRVTEVAGRGALDADAPVANPSAPEWRLLGRRLRRLGVRGRAPKPAGRVHVVGQSRVDLGSCACRTLPLLGGIANPIRRRGSSSSGICRGPPQESLKILASHARGDDGLLGSAPESGLRSGL